jgi:hypothetical protein
MNKYLVISLVVVAALGVGAYFFPTLPAPQIVTQTVGAVPGTDFLEPVRLWLGQRGAVLATSTLGTACTLTSDQLYKFSAFEFTPNTASATWTLPATSTMTNLMKSAGDTMEWTFQNATTSTGINVTLAAGAGWNLSGVDANVDVWPGAAYTARELVKMSCYRQINKDINCEIRENIAAD